MRRFFVPTLQIFKILLLILVVTLISIVVMFVGAEIFSRIFIRNNDIHTQQLRHQVEKLAQIPPTFFRSAVAPYGKLATSAKVQLKTADYEVEYRTNQFGYRDEEWEEKPTGEKVRFLVLGDSFTFGEGVNYGERYTEVVESKIENSELLNTGIPGFGLDEMLLFYLHEGWRYEPKILVIALNWVSMERNYLGLYQNGVVVTEPSITKVNGQFGQTIRTDLREGSIPKELPFAQKSAFIGLLDQILLQKRLSKKAELFEIWRDQEKENISESESEIENRAIALLARFKDEAASRGSGVVIVILEPYRSMDFIKQAFPDLIVINLQPKLKALSQEQSLAFTYDPHFNAHTHQKIGEWLADDLSLLVASVAANIDFVR